jgi:hypothetical protein
MNNTNTLELLVKELEKEIENLRQRIKFLEEYLFTDPDE